MKKSNSTLLTNVWGLLLTLVFALSLSVEASAQCTLVCNDLVQISLDQDCETEVLPGMILEGNGCPNGNLQVQAKINNVWVPAVGNFVATSANINQTIQVRVRDLISNNFCWGHIKVEDKLAPIIDCSPVTITCAITDYTPNYLQNVLNITAAYPNVDENCGNVTLTYLDTWHDLNCTGTINGLSNISAYVVRKWTAVDQSGNSAICQQFIYFERRHVYDVKFPADITVDCSNPNTNPSNTGTPYVTDFGIDFDLYPNVAYCELSLTYTDQQLPVCDGTHKILRTWTVLDWCLPTKAFPPNQNPVFYIQLIKVLDNVGPTFDCPDDLTVSTDPNHCCATVNLPDAIITDNCSRVNNISAMVITYDPYTGDQTGMYAVGGTLTTFSGNNFWNPDTLGNWGTTTCLPVGTHRVIYTAQDDCGNTSTCSFHLTVEDDTPPLAACDEWTKVALGANGEALVNASTFDDGSYDNCSPVHFKVRRMDNNPCQPNNQFYDQVKFCCSDIGDTITVVFRVYDVDVPTGPVSLDFEELHSNDCMVRVLVEDKIKPVCNAPANMTVSCENFDPSLWAYGKATATDNCCIDTIFTTANYSLFDTLCNKGTITRTFRARDCGGLTSQCTQRVVVNYNQNYFVKFPNDVIVTVCDGTGNYGEPTFFGKDCELLGVSFEDQVFTVVPDACFKIERVWTIINWCTYNPNLPCIDVPNPNPNPITNNPANLPGPIVSACGTLAPWAPTTVKINPTDVSPTNYCTFWNANANCYRYKQIIKIIDTQDPKIENCPASPVTFCDITPNDPLLWNESYWWDNVIGQHDLCEGPSDLTITATDACSGSNINIHYLLFLDLDQDGIMETVINSVNTGIAGLGWNTVPFNNYQSLNYAGGTLRAFDERAVPFNQKYGFAIQNTVAGTKKTASVRWNTQQSQTNFTIPELPYGTHKIKWFVEDGCGNESICEYTFIVK
ncbi:MAG: HYR domain-containing protein, partial [Bacteroidota bacterium]